MATTRPTNVPSHRLLAVSPAQTMLAEWNLIMDILGAKASIWPFYEATGTVVAGLPAPGVDLISAETAGAAEALEDDFSPFLHMQGVHSYYFQPTGDHHLAGPDHADFSFATGGFSVGMWVNTSQITAVAALMAKYDSAGGKEEWKLAINSSGKLDLEIHDASASASETGVAANALVAGKWEFVIASFDGTDATPEILFYSNGDHDGGAGTTEETGAFIAMEAGDAPLTIGCAGVTATPTLEWHGRIAIPFLTPKVLSSVDAKDLHTLTRKFMGF